MNSSTDTLIIFSTIIILVVVVMMMLIYAYFIKKKSQLIISQNEKNAQFQQELSLSQIEMRETTLSYIGQELHDDIGQKLTVAKIMTNQLISVANIESKENLKEINTLLGESIQDIRNMSKTFITEQIEHFGFIDSLQRELGRIRKLHIMNVDFSYNKHDIDINPKHGLILFRITQESINNVMKHSRAKNFKLGVYDTDKFLELIIEDDGIGFKKKIDDGSGLKNMRNRAKLINAIFNIISEEDKGTKIYLKYLKT